MMMKIPIKASVIISDGIVGQSIHVIVNPINHQITHLAVKCNWPPFPEVLVPVEQVAETHSTRIHLSCTREELIAMPPFEEEMFIHPSPPALENKRSGTLFWPYVVLAPGVTEDPVISLSLNREDIPQVEFAVRRGVRVEARDGFIGLVDELLVDSRKMQATHLVLRDRHILNRREVTIPVSLIDLIDEDTIYLSLDRKSIEELPTIPVQRWWL